MRAAAMAIELTAGDDLVVATHNAGKLAEIAEFVRPHRISIVSAADLKLPEPEETGATFEDNAALKAFAAARATGRAALADDSGLAVDALGGEPGIHSARWAGRARDFAVAMQKVEDRLAAAGAIEPGRRGARFVSVLCLAAPDGRTEFFRGEVEGGIVWPPRGEGGFGYDPIFVPVGEDETFAEMAAERKQGLSHRARAFAAFAAAKLAR